MSLVQHPSPDLSLIERTAHGGATQLLRRDDENTGVPQTHLIECLGPLRHRQHSIDSHAAVDVLLAKARHLIRHERDQGRNHHRESASLVVAGQGRDLIAERLAGTGGQNPQNVLSGHCRLDDQLLHRASVGTQRLRAKIVKAEPTLKLLVRVVPFPAPIAVGLAAGHIP